MVVDLPELVGPGETIDLEISWESKIPRTFARTGYRGNYFFLAHWFPSLGVYQEDGSWNCHQFHVNTEFFSDYGVYDVRITVPTGWLVGSTGKEQSVERNTDGTSTHRYYQEDVHTFTWTTSPTYREANGTFEHPGLKPVEMRFLYQPEHEGQVERHFRATRAALRLYGSWYGEYPYDQITFVDPAWRAGAGGMEYPTLFTCGSRYFNPEGAGSPEGVTVHEAGHQFWYGVVGNNEFEHAWLDEGLNTFLQYYGEQDYAETYCGGAWTQNEECTYPSRRGPPPNIVSYMQDPDQVPLMTESDLIHKDFGNNGYAKPATGLVMLREHVLDTPQFDAAFQGYSQGWMFKHPQPADFFRSMDDGAGENLAWFWRGWFYTTHANDQAVTDVSVQDATELLGDDSRGSSYVRIQVDNVGGLVMPLEMEVVFADGSRERLDYPVDVWRNNEKTFTAGFFTDKTVVEVIVDPDEGFADIDRGNNVWRRAVTQ